MDWDWVSASMGIDSPTFDDFWSPYLRKENRAKAKKQWNSLCRRCQREAFQVAVVQRSLKIMGSGPELKYIPHASTFLRDRRWEEWRDGVPISWAADCGHNKPMKGS